MYNAGRDDLEQSSDATSSDERDDDNEFEALVAAQAQAQARRGAGAGGAGAGGSGAGANGKDAVVDDDTSIPLGIPVRRVETNSAPKSTYQEPAKPSRITNYRAGGKIR